MGYQIGGTGYQIGRIGYQIGGWDTRKGNGVPDRVIVYQMGMGCQVGRWGTR